MPFFFLLLALSTSLVPSASSSSSQLLTSLFTANLPFSLFPYTLVHLVFVIGFAIPFGWNIFPIKFKKLWNCAFFWHPVGMYWAVPFFGAYPTINVGFQSTVALGFGGKKNHLEVWSYFSLAGVIFYSSKASLHRVPKQQLVFRSPVYPPWSITRSPTGFPSAGCRAKHPFTLETLGSSEARRSANSPWLKSPMQFLV